jgi:ATP-binding cassette, subfamily F, member 2
MTSRWHQKKAKQAEEAFERELQGRQEESVDATNLTTAAAMGGGDQELFEKKLSKEEKKAMAKAKREAKRKGKKKGDDDDDDDDDENSKKKMDAQAVLQEAQQTLDATTDVIEGGVGPGTGGVSDDGIDHQAADALAAAGTICTFSASRKGVDARARDINVTNFTLQHMGAVLLDETEIVLNHGNRYGLIGRNGCGKSTLLKALGARAVPIPNSIDIFFLKEEVEPSDAMTALDAVMSVDEERLKLEKQAEDLNQLMGQLVEAPPQEPELGEDGEAKTAEEIQEEVMEALNLVYERLDALDAATAEVRARSILSGLGFTHEMQSKKTKDFSGGWRMRVSLARALFIQPVW